MKIIRYLFLDELMRMFDAKRRIVKLARLNSNEAALTASEKRENEGQGVNQAPSEYATGGRRAAS